MGHLPHEGSHWVSFHFQQSCDELVWVTVVGKAAIFLALCLHSAVAELLRQRSNKPIRKPSENPIRRHPQNLPHITFYHPPSSPRKSSGGGGGEEGGSVSEGSKRESLASTTSTGRGSVGEEPPAERGLIPRRRLMAVHQLLYNRMETHTLHTHIHTSLRHQSQPQSKKRPAIGDNENPTFQFETDEDL